MSHLTAFVAFMLLTASAAIATTTSQGQGVPAGTGGDGIAGYWWIIFVVVVLGVGIWFYTRRKKTSV